MGGHRFTVLVADDEPEVVESVSDYLGQLARKFRDEITVIKASSGIEVVAAMSNQRIDVLILDYHFKSGINGDEILDQLDDPFGERPVILMSGRTREELDGILIKRHKHFGRRFRFLRKPFDYLEIQAKYLEIQDFFHELPYPFPLAYAHQTLLSSSTAQGKITAMKDLVESIAKLGVTILMSDANRLHLSIDLRTGPNLSQNLTLGAWLVWLQKLLERCMLNRDSAFMPELLDLFAASASGDAKWMQLLLRFKDEVRDPEIGHGYTKEEGWYARLVEEYDNDFQALYEKLAFTARYNMIVSESVDFAEDDELSYCYVVRVLMGSEAKFRLARLCSQSRLKRGDVYLRSTTGQMLSLHPLAIYSVCEKCSLGRLYIADQISRKQITYNSFCNHRRRVTSSKPVFDAMLV